MADSKLKGNAGDETAVETEPSVPQVSVLGLEFNPHNDPLPAPSGSSSALPEPALAASDETKTEAVGEKDDIAETATEDKIAETATVSESNEPQSPAKSPIQGRKKPEPYLNRDRVKTGGQREKPSAEELTERMQRIKLQNAQIQARREQADRDAQAYEDSMIAEREAAKKQRQTQDSIDRERAENAKRKQGKMDGREWDAGKDPQQTRGRGRGRVSGGSGGRGERGGRGGRGDRGSHAPRDGPARSNVPAGPSQPAPQAEAPSWDNPSAGSNNDW